MSGHKPGPWAYIKPDGITVRYPQVYSDTGPVCNATWTGDVRETHANARLIAAAPELLEALQGLAAGDFGAGEWTDVMEAFAQMARAAIKKATGGAA